MSKKPAQPTILKANKDLVITPVVPDLPVTDGKCIVVKLDKNGQEIEGSDFTIGLRTYNERFANNPNFKLKKK